MDLQQILRLLGVAAVSLGTGYALGRSSLLQRLSSPKPPAIVCEDEDKECDRTQDLTPNFKPALDPNRRQRLIIVAKNLPLIIKRTPEGGWDIQWEDARSFLANLRILEQYADIKFVGAPPIEIARSERDEFEEALEPFRCQPVYVEKELAHRFFNGFCRSILWPLLHYSFPAGGLSQFEFTKNWDDLWQAYQAVNSLYGQVVCRTVESPHDAIWIQNYHLFLLPAHLRPRIPKATIGLFVHTPFPSSDIFRMLPQRNTFLTAMLCSDLIGFHTFDYARHFLSCTKRLLDLDYDTLPGGLLGLQHAGRHISIIISHVGIDSKFFHERSQSEAVQQRVLELKKEFANKKVIVGVDDLDLIKGPLLKVQAFDRFLTDYPERRDRVVLVEVVIPNKSVPERGVVHNALHQEIAQLKRKFGDQVIKVIEGEEVDLDQLVAVYYSADVGIISTSWDGLNVTPLEFTAAQPSSCPGALVISEFTGCARSLNGVIRVNPWNLEQVSSAINQALHLSVDQRKAFHERRFAHVMSHSHASWATGFLEHLQRTSQFSSKLNFVTVGWGSNVQLVGLRSDFRHLDDDEVIRAYRSSSLRFFFVDYDGTLTPNTGLRSKHSKPSPEVSRALRILSEDPKNVVFVITGRKRTTLHNWFKDLKQVGLAAEKGCFLRWPERLARQCRDDLVDGKPKLPKTFSERKLPPEEGMEPFIESEWEAVVPVDDDSWKVVALEVIRAYTSQTDGSWIEDKEFAIVWHYENADPEYGAMQAAELEKYLSKVLSGSSVDVVKYDYSRILEIKPHGVNKGLAVAVIMESVIKSQASTLDPASITSPFILVCGDDRSDEEMFIAAQTRPDLQESIRANIRNGKPPISRRLHAESEKKKDENADEKKIDPNTFTICVGLKPSKAHYYLQDEQEVLHVLSSLSTCSRLQNTNHKNNNKKISTGLPDPDKLPTISTNYSKNSLKRAQAKSTQ